MGANPIAGAMIFAVLSALGIEWAGSRGRIREDSAIGIIWSVGMAVGATAVLVPEEMFDFEAHVAEKTRRARLGGIGVDGVPQKSKDTFLRQSQLLRPVVGL